MDQQKVEALAQRVVSDMAASFSMALGHIGDRLGLFRAMKDAGPMTSDELAAMTGLNERYVREWLKAMVAAEYLDYEPTSDQYVITPDQAYVLADDTSPVSVGGALQLTAPTVANTEKLVRVFREGGGIPYSEIGPDVPEGIARFFGPGYANFLVQEWLPAVPGLPERLKAGVHVADIGCGYGVSTMTMAAAFPTSQFLGIDADAASIFRARRVAAERGLGNVEWRAEPAHLLPRDRRFALICAFDCIHDMVDPKSTLRAIRGALATDGVFLWSRAERVRQSAREPSPRRPRVSVHQPAALPDRLPRPPRRGARHGDRRARCARTRAGGRLLAGGAAAHRERGQPLLRTPSVASPKRAPDGSSVVRARRAAARFTARRRASTGVHSETSSVTADYPKR
jgi:2-polyprenyl-3-methyl-5-hydroxy-6-metoxy-1,4-benzoquinol methylase